MLVARRAAGAGAAACPGRKRFSGAMLRLGTLRFPRGIVSAGRKDINLQDILNP